MKNSSFARFARAFFIFWHFDDVLVLSTTWNELFCSCVDNVSIWWQMFNFVLSCPKRWFQFNSRRVRTHFSTIMTLNNWKNDCRNAKLHFQMTFSLPSTSCLLKLPNEAHVSYFIPSSERSEELRRRSNVILVVFFTMAIWPFTRLIPNFCVSLPLPTLQHSFFSNWTLVFHKDHVINKTVTGYRQEATLTKSL